jgi:cysteine synthase B
MAAQETPKPKKPPLDPTRPARTRVLGDTLWSTIGNTPLLPIPHLAAAEGIHPNITILAKAEWFNASGSVKARPALALIEDGEKNGKMVRSRTIIEATSGNMGIALAMIGAAKGYKVKLAMPANVSQERKMILEAYGAELLLTDPLEGIDLSIRTVAELVKENPGLYFHTNQYDNPINWHAHYNTTGPEIWEQTYGTVTHFVAGLGTAGTLMGVGRRLRMLNPNVQIISVEPANGMAIIEGLKHMESSIVPENYDPTFPDHKMAVEYDAAHAMARRLALEEGLFVGNSAGAAAWAAIELAKTLAEDSVVVTLFPDGGEKYLSLG